MTDGPTRLVEVKVQPRARKAEVLADGAAGLIVRVVSAPEHGRANAEVRALVAEHFGLPPSRVRIVRGERSRRKLLAIET
jgi:uncharacterized protein (TIGR00251 family)